MTTIPSPAARAGRVLRDRPVIALVLLLVALVAVLQTLRHGIVNERWIANTVKFAIPLALLAGCQTLAMLTGGIDLSAATVATMAAFVISTQGGHDPGIALALATVRYGLVLAALSALSEL